MINQDTISRGLSVLAVMIALYLSTFDLTNIIFFPTLLLVTGLVFQAYMIKKQIDPENEDYLVSTDSPNKLVIWTLVGSAGLRVISAVAPIFTTPTMDLSGFDAVLYSVLMAISEEQFFRGFLSNLLGLKSKLVGCISSALIFAVYHLAIDRTSTESLFYVFAAGLLLAVIGYRSKTLSAPMLIHIVNNVWAFTR